MQGYSVAIGSCPEPWKFLELGQGTGRAADGLYDTRYISSTSFIYSTDVPSGVSPPWELPGVAA